MDDRRTLNELDPPAWDRLSSDDTHLVRRCIYLRQIPLADFDVEDLRMMIGQQVSLRFLVPRAIDVLERNPLAEGDMYAGDFFMLSYGSTSRTGRRTSNSGSRSKASPRADQRG